MSQPKSRRRRRVKRPDRTILSYPGYIASPSGVKYFIDLLNPDFGPEFSKLLGESFLAEQAAEKFTRTYK